MMVENNRQGMFVHKHSLGAYTYTRLLEGISGEGGSLTCTQEPSMLIPTWAATRMPLKFVVNLRVICGRHALMPQKQLLLWIGVGPTQERRIICTVV